MKGNKKNQLRVFLVFMTFFFGKIFNIISKNVDAYFLVEIFKRQSNFVVC